MFSGINEKSAFIKAVFYLLAHLLALGDLIQHPGWSLIGNSVITTVAEDSPGPIVIYLFTSPTHLNYCCFY